MKKVFWISRKFSGKGLAAGLVCGRQIFNKKQLIKNPLPGKHESLSTVSGFVEFVKYGFMLNYQP
jgi:hypothetical protein